MGLSDRDYELLTWALPVLIAAVWFIVGFVVGQVV